jgi:hypothetical protein
MATIEICDICSKRETVKRISYCYDREMGPAGSHEDVFETYDLCDACELAVLKSCVSKITGYRPGDGLAGTTQGPIIHRWDFNKLIIEAVKAGKKRHK